jgi:NADH-quinone oxidoreductase subunit N
VSFDQINNAIQFILPEVVLIATVCVMFLAGPFLVTESGIAQSGLRHRWGVLSLIALSTAAAFWWKSPVGLAVTGPFRLDELTWYARGLSLLLGIVIVLTMWNQVDDARAAECHACLLTILAGANFTAAANDLVTLFLGLEMVSIPTYILLYLPKRDDGAREATIKYFLLSVFSSAMVLYGLALIYGATGTTNLASISNYLRFGWGPLVALGAALVVAGIAFRVTAVPFHFYAPDVFQGSPAFMAGLLSFVPKVVGFVVLIRLMSAGALSNHASAAVAAGTLGGLLKPLITALAAVTMIVGNLMALRQTNIHRLMAYSSVAHAGYMLVGLSVGQTSQINGINALLFYLTAYGIMTLGVFAVLAAINPPGRSLQTIDDLAGLSRHHSACALMLAILMFSLTGLPPTGGFIGKFNLFMAACSDPSSSGFYLAIVLAVNAAVSAFYYLRVVGAIYLQPGVGPSASHIAPAPVVAAALCTILTLGLFAKPEAVWDAAGGQRPGSPAVAVKTDLAPAQVAVAPSQR